ncbi:MAG: CRISPR-associated exonuclease Cas4 [Archaeoglobi archaeon]|nr:CRISPR-associated exonuclease Cas4 [Archaeoglobi archaeon]
MITMISSSFEFPVTLIKYYLFCPRIPYFILFLGINERVTESMIEGREEHEKFFKREKRRGHKLVNVFLRSEKYGIYGFVDEIIREKDGYHVVEFKNTEFRKEMLKMHFYQAAAYALLVEDNFGRVVKITVKYRDREVTRPFSLGVRKYLISIINKIAKMEEIPFASSSKDKRKCRSCGFLRICMEI